MNNLKFQRCLNKNKIKTFSNGPKLVFKEMKVALKDWKSAKESLKNNNYKWSTIQSYYSMFHVARALLFNKGYREKSHYCLVIAIRELYVNEGLLSFSFVEAFQLGKTLRENADYHDDFSQLGAKKMLKKAKGFFSKAKKIFKK